MRMRTQWLAIAVVALTVVAIASGGGVQAQTPVPGEPAGATAAPTPPPFQPGDILWTFAAEQPFFDDRIAGAIRGLMAPLTRVTQSPAEQSVPAHRIIAVQRLGLLPAFVAAPGDAPLLLHAAGYGQSPPFMVVGQCKVWTSSPPAGVPSTTPPPPGQPVAPPPALVQPGIDPSRASSALTRAMLEALRGLGILVRDCVRAATPAEAHLLVRVHGDPAPPTIPERSAATFLSSPSSAVPGAGSPRPAATGNDGLTAIETRAARTEALALILACAMLVAARSATRRRGGV